VYQNAVSKRRINIRRIHYIGWARGPSIARIALNHHRGESHENSVRSLVGNARWGRSWRPRQGLHAQAKPPVYTVTEIDVTNIDAYTKEYAPLAQASIKASGGKLLAAGQKVTALEGDPPKPRVAIQMWDSLEKAQAWRNSAEYKKAREIGNKYAKFRAFAVEGLPQ
jgi:uncharacterized protein (DUF1330 family)